MTARRESRDDALARLYDLDLSDDPGDLDLYLALAARTGDRILELAVGTGRVAIPLARAGHRVVGVDRDPAMLRRARQSWSQAGSSGTGSSSEDADGRLELVEADILQPRGADLGRYRLVILALNSLLLFADRGQQEQVVRRLASHLAPDGIAVIDAWQPQPADLVRLDGRLSLEWLREDLDTGQEITKTISGWYDGASRSISLTTLFEGSSPGSPTRRWVRQDRLRLVTGDDLVAWAETAGLEVEQLAGDYDLAPFDGSSERAILVARKV